MDKNGDSKEIYFIILYTRKEKEGEKDFIFTKNVSKLKNVYTKEIEGKGENKIYLYEKVIKFIKEAKNEKKNKKEEDNIIGKETNNDEKNVEKIEIQFEIVNDIYIISFNIEDNYFYYDFELTKGNKSLANNAKDITDQNTLDYYKKFEIFLEALNKNKKEEKIDILYEETIKLYSQKKNSIYWQYYLLKYILKRIYVVN